MASTVHRARTTPASCSRAVIRTGSTLRGLPPGRDRYTAAAEGRNTATPGSPAVTDGSARPTSTVPSSARRASVAPRASTTPSTRFIPASRAANRERGRRMTSSAGPCSTTAPSSTTATSSASARTSSRSWVTITAVRSPPRRRSARTRRISAATSTSSADRGSSSRTTLGSTASARARATRCCCPPESCAGRRSARSSHPTSASSRRAPSRARARGTPAERGPNATFSAALRWGKSSGSWARDTTPRACGGTNRSSPVSPASARTRPPTRTVPELGRTSPDSRPRSVDFPAPLGPRTARTRPGATSRRR